MSKKSSRILYFLKGAVPTPEEYADAQRYGTGVVFRNAQFGNHDAPEAAEGGVAGTIPENYAEAKRATAIMAAPVVPAAQAPSDGGWSSGPAAPPPVPQH